MYDLLDKPEKSIVLITQRRVGEAEIISMINIVLCCHTPTNVKGTYMGLCDKQTVSGINIHREDLVSSLVCINVIHKKKGDQAFR